MHAPGDMFHIAVKPTDAVNVYRDMFHITDKLETKGGQ
jgi:hypothetical protein